MAALETQATVNRGPPGRYVHAAVDNITDGLKACIDTVESLRNPSANDN